MGSVIVQALKGVDLVVNEGDFLVVAGPSGSGKSTLMNIIGLLDRPDEGSYFLNGKDVSDLSDDERSRVRGQSGLSSRISTSCHVLPRFVT